MCTTTYTPEYLVFVSALLVVLIKNDLFNCYLYHRDHVIFYTLKNRENVGALLIATISQLTPRISLLLCHQVKKKESRKI